MKAAAITPDTTARTDRTHHFLTPKASITPPENIKYVSPRIKSRSNG